MENSTPRSLLGNADNLSENIDARVNISRSFLVTESIRRHFESTFIDAEDYAVSEKWSKRRILITLIYEFAVLYCTREINILSYLFCLFKPTNM